MADKLTREQVEQQYPGRRHIAFEVLTGDQDEHGNEKREYVAFRMPKFKEMAAFQSALKRRGDDENMTVILGLLRGLCLTHDYVALDQLCDEHWAIVQKMSVALQAQAEGDVIEVKKA